MPKNNILNSEGKELMQLNKQLKSTVKLLIFKMINLLNLNLLI